MKREKRKEKNGKKNTRCLLMVRNILVFLFSLLIFNFSFNLGFALNLDELVPNQAARLRRTNESVLETQMRNPSPKLVPANNEIRRVVNTMINDLSPSVLIETLYLYKKPAGSSSAVWSETQKLGVLNQLLAISSMAGIQYYSETRGSMRTFFETSQVVDNPTARNPLADPVYRTLPATASYFARQKDLTFGDNVYQYDFAVSNDFIYFIQENITPMSYGIVPVIGRNNLKTLMVIFDCGDSLLIYAASMAKASIVPGIAERVSNSFKNRAEAVINWFTNRVEIVYN